MPKRKPLDAIFLLGLGFAILVLGIWQAFNQACRLLYKILTINIYIFYIVLNFLNMAIYNGMLIIV
jgi:hypothetical protein